MIPRRVVSSVASLAASLTARRQRWLPIPNVRATPVYVREAIFSAVHAASGCAIPTSVLSSLAPKFHVRRRVKPLAISTRSRHYNRLKIVVPKRWCPEARQQQHDAPVPRVRKGPQSVWSTPKRPTQVARGEWGFGYRLGHRGLWLLGFSIVVH